MESTTDDHQRDDNAGDVNDNRDGDGDNDGKSNHDDSDHVHNDVNDDNIYSDDEDDDYKHYHDSGHDHAGDADDKMTMLLMATMAEEQ